MSQKILITKFRFSVSPKEFKEQLQKVAPAFAGIPGCQWKIWTVDEDRNEGGGIYLFQTQKALDDFLESPLLAGVKSDPTLSNLEMRIVDVAKEASEITRAPLMETTIA
jgi:Putative mono-oxygenase ydhR